MGSTSTPVISAGAIKNPITTTLSVLIISIKRNDTDTPIENIIKSNEVNIENINCDFFELAGIKYWLFISH